MSIHKHYGTGAILILVSTVWLILVSTGCVGEEEISRRPVYSPTPIMVKLETPAFETSADAPVNKNSPFPKSGHITTVPAAATLTPGTTLSKLAEGVIVDDLQVSVFHEVIPGEVEERLCGFSQDNFYTCTVDSPNPPVIRMSFAMQSPDNYSIEDLEKLHAGTELVAYPYWMLSRYTPAPPLVVTAIQEDGEGGWYADCVLDSPLRVFSLYLMAGGQNMAAANLYLEYPDEQPAAVSHDDSGDEESAPDDEL